MKLSIAFVSLICALAGAAAPIHADSYADIATRLDNGHSTSHSDSAPENNVKPHSSGGNPPVLAQVTNTAHTGHSSPAEHDYSITAAKKTQSSHGSSAQVNHVQSTYVEDDYNQGDYGDDEDDYSSTSPHHAKPSSGEDNYSNAAAKNTQSSHGSSAHANHAQSTYVEDDHNQGDYADDDEYDYSSTSSHHAKPSSGEDDHSTTAAKNSQSSHDSPASHASSAQANHLHSTYVDDYDQGDGEDDYPSTSPHHAKPSSGEDSYSSASLPHSQPSHVSPASAPPVHHAQPFTAHHDQSSYGDDDYEVTPQYNSQPSYPTRTSTVGKGGKHGASQYSPQRGSDKSQNYEEESSDLGEQYY